MKNRVNLSALAFQEIEKQQMKSNTSCTCRTEAKPHGNEKQSENGKNSEKYTWREGGNIQFL